MSPINAGLLDRKILLQRATRTQDTITGQDVLSWDVGDAVRAQWLPGAARETWQARQIESRIEATYRTYYYDDVTPDRSRVVGHDGRMYDVLGVTEEGRREGLLIHVVAHGEAP